MKYSVIDLFCGCGGLSEGFKLAGFNIIGGIDFNQKAIETYQKNFKNSKAICTDLLNFSEEDIKSCFPNLNQVDVIIGGPPCQGFSSANRHKMEGDDPRNKLFFEFVKFVDLAKPKIVLIENVRGIITNNNGYAKNRIYEIFEERGYNVTHKILDASEYGVPQKRLRNFFVITKNLEKFNFDSLKKAKHTVTVSEAISELYDFDDANKDKEPIIKSCKLHNCDEMIEYVDSKNGVDVAIVENFLTFIVYGQGYLIKNKCNLTKVGIQIRPYNHEEFLNFNQLQNNKA